MKKENIQNSKSGLEDYYNEIYRYLINHDVMLKRLEYTKKKNRKTQEKRRTLFRKLIKKKYRLFKDRLQYLYKYNNKEFWLDIMYKDEKNSLLNYVHYANNYLKRESMYFKIIEIGYYW